MHSLREFLLFLSMLFVEPNICQFGCHYHSVVIGTFTQRKENLTKMRSVYARSQNGESQTLAVLPNVLKGMPDIQISTKYATSPTTTIEVSLASKLSRRLRKIKLLTNFNKKS